MEISDNELKRLWDKIQKCEKCECAKREINTFGGSINTGKVAFSFNRAKLLLLGETPNYNRQMTEKIIPFDMDSLFEKGKSGEILKKAADECGMKTSQFCTANLVKCSVYDSEFISSANICKNWLDAQLDVIKPLLIICLGAKVREFLHGKELEVTKYETYLGDKYDMICIKHPAWVIRDFEEHWPFFLSSFKRVAEIAKNMTARQVGLSEYDESHNL